MWYGKGPGVDRAGDALKHGNAYGASPHGGVLVVAGDDHGCVSSSMPHQSDAAMQSWHMPVLAPANVAEYLEFGLYGLGAVALLGQLGRLHGALGGRRERLDGRPRRDERARRRVEGRRDGRRRDRLRRPGRRLHYRWPDLPSLKIEARLFAKLDAVRAFARINSIDRDIVVARARRSASSPAARRTSTCSRCSAASTSARRAAAAGVRIHKIGLAYPLEPSRLDAFAAGLDEILVVEEKAGLVEQQLRDLFYNRALRPT
jgi:indolepyruvate ferredoxin oxidoreductase